MGSSVADEYWLVTRESRVDDPWLEPIAQANSGDAQEQSGDHACSYIYRGARPLAVFQHFGGLPSEAGKGSVTAEQPYSYGYAPVRRNHHSIERELADQTKQEAAGKIDEQRAVGKSARRADLHQSLQAVARQRANSAKDSDQC